MNNFLCAEDLRHYRRLPRTLPDRGGEKSCERILDNDLGTDQLNYFLDERKSALAEPKVEKLSSLIKGEWLQDERVVRITKNVGNHLEHQGYSEKGNRLLYPEEALFLMDTKRMVVYYRGLPLSCQEAYNIFFNHPADLLRYQVYCHLSRLGYVVIRHQERVSVTEYERKIGLHKYSTERKSKETVIPQGEIIKKVEVSQQPLLVVPADDHADSNSQVMDVEIARSRTLPPLASHFKPCILEQHPDIIFPDVYGKSIYIIYAPIQNYLPQNVIFNKEMYMIDMRKIYARRNMAEKSFVSHYLNRSKLVSESFAHRYIECMSWHEEQQYKRRRLNNTNKCSTHDQKIYNNYPRYNLFESSKKSKSARNRFKNKIITNAKNWKQYKEELGIVDSSNKVQNGAVSETPTCKPLVNFGNATDTLSILHQLQIIKQHKLSDHISSPITLFKLSYDVYLPAVNYNKSKQMIPNYRLVVTSVLEPLPRIDQVMQIPEYFSDDVPILFAVVDNGDIAFYSFNDVSLPVDVSMG